MDESSFDYADILNSSVDPATKTILLQTGAVEFKDMPPRSDNVEILFPPGYVARPAKAQPDNNPPKAAQAVCVTDTSRDICIGIRDLRANTLVETLAEGEVQIFAGGPDNTGNCKIVLNNNGFGNLRITLTVNNTNIVISDGTVSISADSVNLSGASDYAALASKVDANFAALVAAITAATCAAPGSPLTFAAPSTPSVAASNVKVS